MNRPLVLIAALSVLAVTGCSDSPSDPNAIPSFTTDASATPSPPAATDGGTPPATKTTTAPPKASPTKTQPSGPQIVYYRIKTKPLCPGEGGPYYPVEGREIELEWKVTGADYVTISIDGPGKFGDYDTTFTHKFNFPCDGPKGSIEEHTYLLRTVGGGPVREKTITGEAEVRK